MKAEDLKNSILQLAVEGKLIPQNPNDEAASILLEKIKQEKELLIINKNAKRSNSESFIFKKNNHYYEQVDKKSKPICIDEEIPFDIPDSWEFIRLDNIGVYKKGPFGSALKKSLFVPKSEDTVKVYEQKNAIQKNHNLGDYYITREYYDTKMKGFTVEPGDILVSCAGTIGETYVLPKKIELGIINQALMRMNIVPTINLDYFLLYFDYILKKSAIEYSKGSAIKNIPPFKIFKKLIFPLPPFEEQKRIVDKVEEFLPLIDEYDGAEEQLSKLNSELPKKLKDSILQEAVQGKLVSQDTNDEPASVLLTKIKQEKEQLIKAKKIKKNNKESVIYKEDGHYYEKIGKKGEPVCIDDEIPFEIPDSWGWCKLENISLNVHYGYTASAQENGIARLLRITDIHDNYVNWKSVPFCDIDSEKLSNYKLKNRDIVMARTGGTIGKSYIIKDLDDVAVFASYLIRIIPLENIDENYLKTFFECPFFWSQLRDNSKGTGQPNVNATSLKNLLIPLPPLSEQKRIVDKVEQLFDNVNVLIDE